MLLLLILLLQTTAAAAAAAADASVRGRCIDISTFFFLLRCCRRSNRLLHFPLFLLPRELRLTF
jgi:hypothetical protein